MNLAPIAQAIAALDDLADDFHDDGNEAWKDLNLIAGQLESLYLDLLAQEARR
jgi:hypothetical protein